MTSKSNATGSDSFAVVLAIGPGDVELQRVGDLLESLFTYEPSVSHVVLVDDAMPARQLERCFTVLESCALVTIPNPRRGRGEAWSGGMTAGMFAGFRWIAENTECEFTVKLDSDSLIIAPFAEKLRTAFASHPEVDQFGCYRTTPTPVPELRHWTATPALEKLRRPFTLWRRTTRPWPQLQCVLFRRDRERRRLILAAMAHGQTLGMHCQGGGYAVRGRMLKKLAQAGCFDDPFLWFWAPVCEDTVMSLTIYAQGGQAADLNGEGEVFGVAHIGLPDSPQNLLKRGYSIIHSVKDSDAYREADTRAFFKAKRV